MIVAVGGWILSRGPSATFSDHPRAERIAFAQQDGDVLIKYHRCGGDDLIPYIDASEVVSDDLREWEVAPENWSPDEASWMARRHAVGEATFPPEPFDGPIPPEGEVRLNVHLYSASIENRWHVRVNELAVSDLPEVSIPIRELVAADGATMTQHEWRERADRAC